MKKFFVLLLVCATGYASAQITTPQPSSAGSVSSRIGLTDVKVDYFRPKQKGRKIFGEGDNYLIPYGKIWRTGANSGTRITFSDTVKVEGAVIPSGTYMIFTWPGATEWTLSFYKDLKIGGNASAYDIKNEQARVKVKPEKLASPVPVLTISIVDISDDNTSGKVQISWENTSVNFTVSVSFDARVMQSIKDNTTVNYNNLVSAARYYYDNKKDLKQALDWVNQYFASDPNNAQDLFTMNFKAKIQQAMGDKAGALVSAQKSLDQAKKEKDDFGYIKLNEELIRSLKQ